MHIGGGFEGTLFQWVEFVFCTQISLELPCPEKPPPATDGEGSERNYGPEITTYRCPNGYMWDMGKGIWPYLEMECLNKKWAPSSLPPCMRKC